MVEQLIFTIVSVILFGYIFYKMIKYNESEYIVILVIEALGLAIDFIGVIFGLDMNLFFKCLIYIMSIIIQLFVIILEKKVVDVIKSKGYAI